MLERELFTTERKITPENPKNKLLRINYEDNRLTTIINECCGFIKEGKNIFDSETQEKLEKELMGKGIITGYLEVLNGKIWDLPKETQQTIFYIKIIETASGEIITARGDTFFIANENDYSILQNKYYKDVSSLESKTLKITSETDNFSIIFVEEKINRQRFDLS